MIETRASVERQPDLKAYKCTGWNRRTHRPCEATVIEAWALAGATVKRRCNDCGTWQVIRVVAEPRGHDLQDTVR